MGLVFQLQAGLDGLLMTDFFKLLDQLTEANLVRHGIATPRRYTDQELAEANAQLAIADAIQAHEQWITNRERNDEKRN